MKWTKEYRRQYAREFMRLKRAGLHVPKCERAIEESALNVGEKLGISRQCVQELHTTAIRKLWRRPLVLKRLGLWEEFLRVLAEGSKDEGCA